VFSAAWWALVGWSARFPVGYGLSGSVAGGPEPWVRFGEEHSGRSRRWRYPWRHRWRHRLSCRLSSRRPPRPQSLMSTASGPMAPPHQPPASEWCCCHTPKSSPPTPDPQPPHRKGHRHEPRRFPAPISDPLASRQRTANLGQRSPLFSPSDAPPDPLPQATPPRPSSPAEPHRLRLGSRCPWKATETSANHGLAPPARRKRQQPGPISRQAPRRGLHGVGAAHRRPGRAAVPTPRPKRARS
jgi:hypothetical protein